MGSVVCDDDPRPFGRLFWIEYGLEHVDLCPVSAGYISAFGSTIDAWAANIDGVTELAWVEDMPRGLIQLEIGP